MSNPPWRVELRATLLLAGPLIAAFAGNQLLSLVDTIVAGHLGAVEIAAVGLGGALFFMAVVFPVGLLMGLDPVAAQAVGAGRPEVARRAFREGVLLAVIVAVPAVAIALVAAGPVLEAVGADPEVRAEVLRYLYGRAPAALPALLVVVQRSYLQANDRAGPVLRATIIANLFNLPLSAVLAAGDAAFVAVGLPAPGMGPGWGVLGIGIGSTLVSAGQAWVLFGAVRRVEVREVPPIERTGVRRIVELGWPVGGSYLLEGGVFSAVTILVGSMGTVVIGGHQVALQVASFTFTACMGLGAAASVRVGQAVGRADRPAARLAGIVALATGVGMMTVTAIIFAVFPRGVAGLVTQSAEVVEAAVPLLRVAAVFQIVDGLQVVSAGALRGAGDTRVTLNWAVLGHWVIGLPVGVALAWGAGLGAVGLWWGLTAGLTVLGLGLAHRFVRTVALDD